jgi:hypothetical protein
MRLTTWERGAWADPVESLKTMERIDQIYQRIVKKYDLKPQ